MKNFSAPRLAIAGGLAFALSLLLVICPSPAWAQQPQVHTPGTVGAKRPPPPPPPVRVVPVPPVMTRPAPGVGQAPVPPVRYGRPPLRRGAPGTVRPIARPPATPTVPPLSVRSLGAPPRVIYGGKLPGARGYMPPTGVGRLRLPPPTPRLLLSPPPTPRLANPPITSHVTALPTPRLLPRLPKIAGLPPQEKPTGPLYCSPSSVLYNTGSICFNPQLFTINPAFYPWGLYAPPPFLNAPGFVGPFVPGDFIRYCPYCAYASAGLYPWPSPFQLWQRNTSGAGGLSSPWLPNNFAVFAKPSPPPPPTHLLPAQPSGPAVILVLKNGTRQVVSRYWLGQDWLLHYVTLSGQRKAVPLDQLNLRGTGAANYERGVTFVLPGWPEPPAKR